MTHQWQNVLIGPDSTIREVLEVINHEALKIALVVDKEQRLLGVITDGDIRRGLLNSLDLQSHAFQIMNTSPLVADAEMSSRELSRMMKTAGITAIPIVQDGKVAGLKTLQHINECKQYDNPVFIMAGGFGTRLRPLTDNCPKPMLKIGDKPILETLIRSFVRAGFRNLYISTHYMPEIIRDHFGDGDAFNARIHYVHEDKPLGTGGALGLLPESLSSDLPLIMMNGDVLTNVDFERLLNFHNESKADATLCVREYDYQIPYGVIKGDGNRIISMEEKPVHHFFVNAGIYVISPAIFKGVARNQHIDMPTLLEQHMQKDDSILMFPIHEYWLDIGRMDDFKRAQADIFSLGL